ncbi:MAG TPA: cupredoxin domain-containing protein [Dehalococcoidia bacterium]
MRALNLAFSERTLSFPAGVSATLVLENDDLSVLHDIGVSLPGVGHSEACSGPCTTSVSFTAQAPGRYTFFCSIHADMVGDLIVTP